MKFVDLHVHSIFSSGVDTPSRLLHHAKELGIEIGICDGQRLGCYSGIEIHAEGKKDLKETLNKFEGKVDYILVHGGKDRINRLAVSNNRVDILAHPDLGRKDNGVDNVIAEEARENRVAIEVNLNSIIQSKGTRRVNTIKNVKKNLILSRKYKFNLIIASGAKCRYDLRASKPVAELLKLIGFTANEVLDSMENVPREILKRNEIRRDKDYIMEGVMIKE